MIDAEGQVKEYLLSGAGDTLAFSALVGSRVHVDTGLPVGYKITDGPALVFKIRGGKMPYHSHSLHPSLQFLSFAATRDEAVAVYQALFNAVNGKQTTYFKMAALETPGQLLKWAGGMNYYLSFWRFWFGNP
jgi:hypothetical protein